MAFSETAALKATMALQDNTAKPAAAISKRMHGLEKDFARTKKAVGGLGHGIGTGLKVGAVLAGGAVGFLAVQIKSGIESLAEMERTGKLTAAVIKSTGGVAHVTARHVDDLAQSLEDKTTIDDKEIAAAETMLLRFTNVRNELGAGNKIYDKAVQAATDLSAATGKDLNSSMLLLGKSLNDPAKSLGKLQKAGLTFTASEQKMIKNAKTHSEKLAAQKLILDKVSKSYGGSAVAAADSYAGSQARLKDAVEELRKKLAQGLLPGLKRLADRLTAFLIKPETINQVSAFGRALGDFPTKERLDKLGGILKDIGGGLKKIADHIFDPSVLREGGSVLQSVFDGLKNIPWQTVADGLALSGQVAKEAFSMFKSLDPELQKVIIGALALNKLSGGLASSVLMDLAGIALKSLTTITAGVVNVVGGTVNSGGVGGAAGAAGGVAGAAKKVAGIIPLVAIAEIASVPAAAIGDAVGAHYPTIAELADISAANAAAGHEDALLTNLQAGVAAATVAGKVAEVTAATNAVRAQTSADGARLVGAIQAKDLSVVVNNSTSVSVSVRDLNGSLQSDTRYGTTRKVN